jgi:hypothetical protein
MKIPRIAVAGFLTLGLVGPYIVPIHKIGFSYREENGVVSVDCGTHPAGILWSVVAIFLYFALLKQSRRVEIIGNAGMGRRAAAMLIDFFFVVIATSSIDSLIPLVIEARRTGHFAWYFQRDYAVSTDSSILTPLVFVVLIEFFFYFVIPLTRGKQTVGDYLMRIRVAPPFGYEGRFTMREACRRVFYAFMGLSLWPYTLAKGAKMDGRTWYDRVTNCEVILVKYD